MNSAPAMAVLGAGAWGNALHSVYRDRCNAQPEGRGTHALVADTILVAVPAQNVPDILPRLAAAKRIIMCCKGIIERDERTPAQWVRAAHPATPIGVLSGPNFAHEISAGLPAAATLACDHAEWVQEFSTPRFRLYWTDDVIGVELAGALKNVLAIACGIVDGLGLGENSRAAIITRGLSEIGRYVVQAGGNRDTLMGLCGVGDVILTCTSERSRNYRYGIQLATGDRTPRETVEGARTALAVRLTAPDDTPILAAVKDCVAGQLEPRIMIDHLLSRPIRTRREGL